MKSFDIPVYYKSPLIGQIKNIRSASDPKKKDPSPTLLNFGNVKFHIARHFGFCYGVENAIEISYRTLNDHPNRNIYLLSQMIHNPLVNADLLDRGLKFIQDTEGNQLVPWDEVHGDDIVITPAFGTTREIEDLLKKKGIEIAAFDTTCPFVTRVWKKAAKLGETDHTIIIHGKHEHEETRATFSHSAEHSHAVVIRDMNEAKALSEYMTQKKSKPAFYKEFEGKYTPGFDPEIHFKKVGVVNQTTMLATETQAIADFIKKSMEDHYGIEEIRNHFADTRDTLCYATNENQNATLDLLQAPADLAIVVGGYNSSNTSHLAELLEEKFPTYYIEGAGCISEDGSISHFNQHEKVIETTEKFLLNKSPLQIAITSGASCPDAVVDEVIHKVLSLVQDHRNPEEALEEVKQNYSNS